MTATLFLLFGKLLVFYKAGGGQDRSLSANSALIVDKYTAGI